LETRKAAREKEISGDNQGVSLRIVRLFGAASLQGSAHPGWRTQGVPPGGAFDQRSALIANALVGNAKGELCLELGMGTGSFEADKPLSLAIVGCAATLNNQLIQNCSTFQMKRGDQLDLNAPLGARSYLAVSGGWTELTAGMIAVGTNGLSGTDKIDLPAAQTGPWRVIASTGEEGPLTQLSCKVSHRLDRIGIRLDSNAEISRPGIRSEPASLGTIQVPPAGGPIILGPDGPTVGGYAKLGAVIRADWDRLGQLKPGDEVRFMPVSIDEARELWHEYEAETTRLLTKCHSE